MPIVRRKTEAMRPRGDVEILREQSFADKAEQAASRCRLRQELNVHLLALFRARRAQFAGLPRRSMADRETEFEVNTN
jgi:hypothetical protein